MSRNIKILLVSPTFPPAVNGLANVAYAYAEGLKNAGFKVEIFTPGSKRYEYGGLEVKCLPISGSFSIRNPPRGPIKEYKEFLENSDADIAICHAFQNIATDLALVFFKKIKIYHSHGISWRSGISQSLIRAVLRRLSYLPYEIIGPRLLSYADAGVFLGRKANSDRTFDSKYFNERPSVIIPNASHFPAGFRRKYRGKRKLRLLVVGSCTKEKGFLPLGELLPMLHADSIEVITVCTMENSPYLSEFSDIAETSSNCPVEIFLNKTAEELLPYYENADLLLNLSLSECYPLVMADAVNVRLPTICFDTGYQSEIPGAKTFNNLVEIACFLNNFDEHVEEIENLSMSTIPYSWSQANKEYSTFIESVCNVNGKIH